MTVRHAAGTGGSVVVERCQSCDSPALEPVLFVGYLPPVNAMPRIGTRPREQPAYPAQLLRCPKCELVQLGLVVDPAILFPPEYPYTSGTTRILRENFAQLRTEASELLGLRGDDLVVDIGSNDGTLLSNFAEAGNRVRGIEPTDTGKLAQARGVPTLIAFFGPDAVDRVLAEDGQAALVTAANVFAHIEDVHAVIEGILRLLRPDGTFISESHYWISLLETVQYDTVYHEHLRYYSLTSLRNLLAAHGLEVFHARRIPTHGGSIRVYAARTGARPVRSSVGEILGHERAAQGPAALDRFRRGVVASKLGLHALLRDAKAAGARVHGIGAPSRASTLVSYVGLDDGIVDCVGEISGSHKIGRYMPGTLIPVVDEQRLFDDQPERALLFSWHIADELVPKLRARGFRGRFIVPLPAPREVA
ncbi:MAG TPA: class I SAM-dependent methyltransferase [Candidatus Limnocylindria bacterium]|nr:class I SAM-dependent methyltransferase [Candidatus Limnocylindria bacterium]